MPIEQIDLFMGAIAGNESAGSDNPTTVTNPSTGAHGIFQIMPSNWEPWSQETFGYVAPKTAANQTAVARKKMMDYYKQFGDWDSVAISWFAGPDAAKKYNEGDMSVLTRSDGYSTVQEYLDKYRNAMNSGGMGEFESNPYAGLDLENFDTADIDDPDSILLDVFDAITSKLAGGERVDLEDEQLANVPDSLAPFDFARSVNGDLVDSLSSTVQGILGQLGQAGLYAALAQPGDAGLPEDAESEFDPGQVELPDGQTEATGNQITDIATKYLGVPYLWGGTNPNKGLDCSGFVQLVYKQLGVDLPRVSRAQATVGKAVSSIDEALPGDLVSFGNPVHHIGIYIGNGKIIHAPRTGRNVSIDTIWENPTSIRRVTGSQTQPRQSVGSTSGMGAVQRSGSTQQPTEVVEETFGNLGSGGSAVRPV